MVQLLITLKEISKIKHTSSVVKFKLKLLLFKKLSKKLFLTINKEKFNGTTKFTILLKDRLLKLLDAIPYVSIDALTLVIHPWTQWFHALLNATVMVVSSELKKVNMILVNLAFMPRTMLSPCHSSTNTILFNEFLEKHLCLIIFNLNLSITFFFI